MTDEPAPSAASGLAHLWAGWRSTYITAVSAPDDTSLAPDASGSLFERILRLPDDEAFVVHRGAHCSVLLNAYPYTSGHVLVLPNRAVAELEDLSRRRARGAGARSPATPWWPSRRPTAARGSTSG